MPQEQIMDLIDHVRNLHAQLSIYYEELSRKSDQARVKILLDYLSDAEMRHEEALAKYEHEFASPDVNDTWFKFEPELLKNGCTLSTDITPDMDVDAVLREVLKVDGILSKLYTEIVKRADSKRIKEVFSNLLVTNEKEIRNLARDFAHMHDW